MITLVVIDDERTPYQWWINFCEKYGCSPDLFHPTGNEVRILHKYGATCSFTIKMVNTVCFLNYELHFKNEEDATVFLLTFS